jgi:outer membrane protein TolC
MKTNPTRALFFRALLILIPAGGIATAAESGPLPDPLDLPAALEYALSHNFAIQQARERIKQQSGVELEVSARRIPTVSAAGNYTRQDESLSSPFSPADRDWGLQVQASQIIYSGGAVMASGRSATLAREAAELELRGVVNEQLLAARAQFFTVLLAQQQIGVQEENIKLLEEQLRNARNRFEAGATSNFEVLRAEVALANGRPDLITARNNYRIALEELRLVIGYTDNGTGAFPAVTGSLNVEDAADYDLVDALNAARSRRPELQRLAKLEQAGEKQVDVARAGYRPEVSLFGQYQWAKGFGVNGWDNRREGWIAGVQTQWAIFDGRATAGRVAQARSQFQQTRLAVEEAGLAVDVEVRRAHSSLTEAWDLVSASGKVVEQAEEALRLANVRYSAGTATQLDVLTSQVELTRARLNQLQAFYRYHVALATLRKAMGLADVALSS